MTVMLTISGNVRKILSVTAQSGHCVVLAWETSRLWVYVAVACHAGQGRRRLVSETTPPLPVHYAELLH